MFNKSLWRIYKRLSNPSRQEKFVRAWAYNGFYLLAVQHGEYEAEARQLLTMALRDEPASVKARVRNVLKNWPETQQPA